MSNNILMSARIAKNDEFYTRYKDIEAELQNYKEFFIGKTIYCPCDTLESNFVKYFQDNFNKFELKELAFSACMDDRFWQLHHEDDFYITNMIETGDIRSKLIQNKIREYDIIVTNPPPFFFVKGIYSNTRKST